MAIRPIFIPQKEYIGVLIKDVEFEYFGGFSIAQKQRSIRSLHRNAELVGACSILEVSTKSEVDTGRELSAFNLKSKTIKKVIEFSVERAFQGSKVFQNGGPYTDLFHKESIKAKKDERIRNSGELVEFKFFSYIFDINPPTFFYDWLYINTLLKNSELISKVKKFEAFTDIEFNPKRSINCQAYSLALFLSLLANNVKIEILKDPKAMYEIVKDEYEKRWGLVFDDEVVKTT